MSDRELESTVLNHVNRKEYRPVKPRVIAKQLGLISDDQLHELKRAIKRLTKSGKILYGSGHLIMALPAAAAVVAADAPAVEDGTPPLGKIVAGKLASGDRITGKFRRAQGGFGFVRPSNSPPGADRALDVFIPANRCGDAASGDVVLVKLSKRKSPGRMNPEGEIIEVVERDTHRFVGTYFEQSGEAFVRVDGTVFSKPISVGDPGAKNAKPDDKVVFEMVRFPSQMHDGEGAITEVLGARGTPGVDTLSIIREFNLPEEFPEDVLQNAREEADKFDESVPADRTDLTAETVITIDPVDARDFDDAISLERTAKGHWRLGVHIADVSHFVKPKTPLDREAHARATSVYLPDRVIPMLPEIISNSLASLQPDRVRYTKTVFIEFTPEGVRVDVEPHSAAIRSQRRFTYEQVDEYLADRAVWKNQLAPQVFDLLGRMHELAMLLRDRRMKRGSLELSMPEVKIDLDGEGRVCGAHVAQNTESHQIIEEFMLAANEAVADMLAEKELFFLRRVHQSPDPRKLKVLTEFVTELGFPVESLESRFELQRLLKLVEGKPEQHAVNYALLRSLQQAVYSPAEEGHYALASDCYCHFTSPIRRYPDLTVHRLMEAAMLNRKINNDFEALAIMGEHCSDRERRAESAERSLVKLKLLNYMSERVGEELDAIVTGVEEFGLFVQGIAIPAEGLIHVSSLADDYYQFERASHSLTGRQSGNAFRLGDRLRVAVARVDVDRRELDFRLAARLKRDGARPAAELPSRARGDSSRRPKPNRKPDGSGGKGKRVGKPLNRPNKNKKRG